MVTEGWVLKRALLVDGHSRVELPVAVFDGQSFREPIQQLQRQWQQLLQEKPEPTDALTSQQLINWHHQLITYYQQQLCLLQAMVLCLEKVMSKVAKKRNAELRKYVGRQYATLLASQKRLLDQTKAHRERAIKRLRLLEGEV